MAAKASSETTIRVPRGLLLKPFGFSLDIGGSCAKCAYYDANDPDNGPEEITIHLVLFLQNETEKVCELLMKKFNLPGNPDWADHLVYTTGIGGHQYINIFKEKLGVKIKNLTEMDCFVKAFQILRKTLTKEQFLLEKPSGGEDKLKELQELGEQFMKNMEGSSDMKFYDVKSKEDEEEAIENPEYPCGLCMVGSGSMLMMLEESGAFMAIDHNQMAGRMFIGLGSLLTDGQDYDGIMELAERGSVDSVCTMTSDITTKTEQTDIYSSLANWPNMPLFMFGKAVGKKLDNFNAEDLARTWVSIYTETIVQLVPLQAKLKDLKRVFFVGNFFNHPLIRELITTQLMLRTQFAVFAGVEYEFVRSGGHFGAIGALMTDNVAEESLPRSSANTPKE